MVLYPVLTDLFCQVLRLMEYLAPALDGNNLIEHPRAVHEKRWEHHNQLAKVAHTIEIAAFSDVVNGDLCGLL